MGGDRIGIVAKNMVVVVVGGEVQPARLAAAGCWGKLQDIVDEHRPADGNGVPLEAMGKPKYDVHICAPTDRRQSAVTSPQAGRGGANTSSSFSRSVSPQGPQAGRGHVSFPSSPSSSHLFICK